jgi:hypothetical protein
MTASTGPAAMVLRSCRPPNKQARRADDVTLARVAQQVAGRIAQLDTTGDDHEAHVWVLAGAEQKILTGEDAGASG